MEFGLSWLLRYIPALTQYKRTHRGAMATAKTTTLTFRIEPELKEALRTAAEREHRSIANMVAVLIMDHCEKTVSK